VQEGRLTRDEAERLRALASRDTSTLAINALTVFGAAGVSARILALKPSFEAGANSAPPCSKGPCPRRYVAPDLTNAGHNLAPPPGRQGIAYRLPA